MSAQTGWTAEARRVANFLCSLPSGNATLTRDDAHSLLLESGGALMARGRLYNIVAKDIGAGVYKVHLTLANP
jgi:hypothetical protein